MSGPNLAKEIAAKVPSGTVIASHYDEVIGKVQEALSGPYFRVYSNRDVQGVELGGVLKNIYAIATGLVAALKMGDNTMGMLITRGLAEMSRFAEKMGSNPITFLGLAGVGDLVTTCTSPLSRNYRVGYALGQGKALDEAIREIGEVAEGVNTVRIVKAKLPVAGNPHAHPGRAARPHVRRQGPAHGAAAADDRSPDVGRRIRDPGAGRGVSLDLPGAPGRHPGRRLWPPPSLPSGICRRRPAAAAWGSDAPARKDSLRALLKGKYLDCHVHTAGIGAGGSGIFVGKGLRESWKLPVYLKAFQVSEEELRRHGDALVLERLSATLARSATVGAAVVLALDGPVDASGNLDSSRVELYVPGDFVAREVRKYPNLLYGASVNPKRHDALERLRRAKADGAVLVKWLPSIMHFDPSDTALTPFYLALKELDLPLLTHAGKESSFHSAADSLCDPRRLSLPVRLGVKVIVAHVATPGKNRGEANHERLLSMFAGHPDLYADISSLTQVNKLFLLPKILPREEAGGRLLFGSDYPLINTRLVSPWYYLHRLPFRHHPRGVRHRESVG